MYNSEQLVRWSREYLKVSVRNESIEQIRNIRQAADDFVTVTREYVDTRDAVLKWLTTEHEGSAIAPSGYYDFILTSVSGRRIGYKVVNTRRWSLLDMRIDDFVSRAYHSFDDQILDEHWIILVGIKLSQAEEIWDIIQRRAIREGSSSVGSIFIGLIMGALRFTESGDRRFTPIRIFSSP
jgi:hypothetical protein